MGTIYAELNADGEAITVLAVGEPEDVAVDAKRLALLTPLFSKAAEPGALTVPATWPAVVQLANTFGPQWRPQPRLQQWIGDQVLARTSLEHLGYRAPAGLTPYPWQVAGAQMIGALGRVLIPDEPGTGKTLTAIMGVLERASRRIDPGPALVVCPASVIDSWVEAWATWAPHVKAVAFRGSPKQRAELATRPDRADVFVVSYETARTDGRNDGRGPFRGVLRQLGFTALVIDECHLVKNAHAERSKAVRRLAKDVDSRRGTIVALSGTPITHHPGDLWHTLACLEPGAWPSRERWVQRYCTVVPGDYKDEVLGLAPHTEPEFRDTLLGQHRRIAKADVLTALPPKVYSVRTVDLPHEWRKVYDDFEGQLYAELPDGSELSVMDVLSMLGHLSRLACAAADVEVTEGPDVDEATGMPKRHVHLELKAPSWKVDALLELLEERPDEQVVVFAPSAQLVRIAGDAAAAAGRRVGYVIGGQRPAERTAAVNAFQAGELDLICATTGAGGVGITLTAARTCVFLQRPWALVESLQAEDRCHRIGSEIHDSVEIVDVVARNTLDTRIRAVLRERAGQLSDLVQDPRIVAELLGGSRVPELERKA